MIKQYFIWATCFFVFSISDAIASTDATEGAKIKPTDDVLIVASLASVHSILVNLLPDEVKPRLLLDANQSPHTTKLKPSQRKALSKADLFFYLDEHIEVFLDGLLSQMPKKQRQIDLHDSLEKKLVSNNPHIWLSPKQVLMMADLMHKELGKALPKHKIAIDERFAQFKEKLTYLDIAIKRQFETIKIKPYAVYHNAYGAFEAQYDLEHVAEIALSDHHHGGNLSVKRTQDLKQLMKEKQVACIYLEPQVNNKKLRRLFNDNGQIQLLTLDPLGSDLPLGADFITQLLSRVAASFRQCV